MLRYTPHPHTTPFHIRHRRALIVGACLALAILIFCITAHGAESSPPVVADGSPAWWTWLWEILNSPMAIAFIGAYLLAPPINRLLAAKPFWRTWAGVIASGLKRAEASIDDDTENKALAKLDAALRYIDKILTAALARPLTEAETQSVRVGVEVLRGELETTGELYDLVDADGKEDKGHGHDVGGAGGAVAGVPAAAGGGFPGAGLPGF